MKFFLEFEALNICFFCFYSSGSYAVFGIFKPKAVILFFSIISLLFVTFPSFWVQSCNRKTIRMIMFWIKINVLLKIDFDNFNPSGDGRDFDRLIMHVIVNVVHVYQTNILSTFSERFEFHLEHLNQRR